MTHRISIQSDFQEFDLDDRVVCERVADRIETNNENDIILDTSKCLLGYDATCRVVDKVIDELISVTGESKLTVVSDYQFPEEIVISFLFRGSKYISSDMGGSSYRTDIIQEELKKSLLGKNISIFVELNGRTQKLV